MKYELTNVVMRVAGRELRRIRALKDFDDVKAGDLGGFIADESNLSQEGNCWVGGSAKVLDDAWVHGDARVYGDAKISGRARVYGKAQVYDLSAICDDSKVFGAAQVYGNARVAGKARVQGNASIYQNAAVSESAFILDDAEVFGSAQLFGHVCARGQAKVFGAAINGSARLQGNASIGHGRDVVWFSNVGSEFGTLTVYRTTNNELHVTRGCFAGSLREFLGGGQHPAPVRPCCQG